MVRIKIVPGSDMDSFVKDKVHVLQLDLGSTVRGPRHLRLHSGGDQNDLRLRDSLVFSRPVF